MPINAGAPKQKKSALDRLADGLTLANQGLGLYVNFQKIGEMQQQKEINTYQIDKAKRQSAGEFTEGELAEKGKQRVPKSPVAQPPGSPVVEGAQATVPASPIARKYESTRTYNVAGEGPAQFYDPKEEREIFSAEEGVYDKGQKELNLRHGKDIEALTIVPELRNILNIAKTQGPGAAKNAFDKKVAQFLEPGGKLSDFDVQFQKGSNTTVDNLGRLFSENVRGQLYPKDIAQWETIINKLDSTIRGRLDVGLKDIIANRVSPDLQRLGLERDFDFLTKRIFPSQALLQENSGSKLDERKRTSKPQGGGAGGGAAASADDFRGQLLNALKTPAK